MPPLPPLPFALLQGYVTVSEINELYSQLGGDINPTPAPILANPCLETEPSSSPDARTPKIEEDQVCVCIRVTVCVLLDPSFHPFPVFPPVQPCHSPIVSSSPPSFSFSNPHSPRPFPKTPSVHWPEDMVTYRDLSPLPDSPPPPLPVKTHHRNGQVMCVCVCVSSSESDRVGY